MPAHIPWQDLLEEQAYLVQILSEAAHDPGGLKETNAVLEAFRADLRTCTIKLAELERESRDNLAGSKHHDSKLGASASRFFHRVTGSIGSDHGHDSKDRDKEKENENDKDKEKDRDREKDKDRDKERKELGQDVHNERLLALRTRKRTLGLEVKNLEVKAQLLRRRTRHHEELQRRLHTLYDRVFDGRKSPSREENEAEEGAQRAQRALHDVQKMFDRHKTLTALLFQADFALGNAAQHLSTSGSPAEVNAAKTCAVQASVVVEQAKWLDPAFFEQERGVDLMRAGWLADVFHTAPTSDSDTPHPIPPKSLQLLQPHHAALLSFLSFARKRAHEHDAALRRALHRSEDARTRKDALKRQVLVKYAGAEGDYVFVEGLGGADDGLEKDGIARMRDVTAGLDSVIPMAPQSVAAAAVQVQVHPAEQRRRQEKEEGPGAGVHSDLPPQPQARAIAAPQARAISQVQQLQSPPSIMQGAAGPSRSPNLTPSLDPRAPPPSREPMPRQARRSSQPQLQPPSASPSRPGHSHQPQSQSQSNILGMRDRSPQPLVGQPELRPEAQPQLRLTPEAQTQLRVAPEAQLQLRAPQSTQAHPQMSMQTPPVSRSGNSTGDFRVQPPPPVSKSPTGEPAPRQARPAPQPRINLEPQSQSQSNIAATREPSPSSRASAPSHPPPSNDAAGTRMNLEPSADPRAQPPPLVSSGSREPMPRQAQPPYPQPQPQSRMSATSEQSPQSRPPAPPSPTPPSNDARSNDVGARAVLGPPRQAPAQTHSSASLAHPSPERHEIHGILKAPAVVPPPPRPSVVDSADPWGVKAATAASSRPQPKIKTMFNRWRSTADKSSQGPSTEQAAPAPPEPPAPPVPAEVVKMPNPRAAMQRLRFVEAVQLIPRPAVDSDPYENEEEESLPPSPRRGSLLLWRGDDDDDREGNEEAGGGHAPDALPRRPGIQVVGEKHHERADRDRDGSGFDPTGAFANSPYSIASPLSMHSSEFHYPHGQPDQRPTLPAFTPSSSTLSPFSTPSSSHSHQTTPDDNRTSPGETVPELLEPLRLPRMQFSVDAMEFNVDGDGAGDSIAGEHKRKKAVPSTSWGGNSLAGSQASSGGNQHSQRSQAPRFSPQVEGVSRDVENTKASTGQDMDGRARLMSPSAPNLSPSAVSASSFNPSTSPMNPRTLPPEHAVPLMTRGGSTSSTDHELINTIFASPPRSGVPDSNLLFTN